MLRHFSHVQLCVTLWTILYQAPLSMGFSRQEYWRGLPFPSPGDLPDPVIEPAFLMSPALAGGFFTTSATWEAQDLSVAAAAAKSLQSCPTLPPHIRQPTRFLCSWDSPGKNTGVGCHFLLQCIKVKSEIEVVPSCPTLHDPMDCSLPGSSVHGIFQARVLEWVAIAFSARLI